MNVNICLKILFSFYCILCFCKFHYFKLDLICQPLSCLFYSFQIQIFAFINSFLVFMYQSVYLSICLSVYMSTCLYVYLSICLYVYLSICLSVYMSVCLLPWYILYILTEHTYLKIINDHFTRSIYNIFYV